MLRLSLNDIVRFYPTESGVRIFNDFFRKLMSGYQRPEEIRTINTDHNGYVELELWEFMRIYGPELYMGAPEIASIGNNLELIRNG